MKNFLYGFQENEKKRVAQPSFSSKKKKSKGKKIESQTWLNWHMI
jgi:hypothetical protein